MSSPSVFQHPTPKKKRDSPAKISFIRWKSERNGLLGLMKALITFRSRPIAKYLTSIGKRYSMLHPDVLMLLHYLAKNTAGNILEIGSYVGGAFIAIANGVRASGRSRRFVTIEAGGASSHPTLPSRDIVSDLKRNVEQNGVAYLVEVVVGAAQANAMKDAARRHLQPGSVGLFVLDADRAVQQTLDAYGAYLGDGSWVVIDDYHATGGCDRKSAPLEGGDRFVVQGGRIGNLRFLWLGDLGRPMARTELGEISA